MRFFIAVLFQLIWVAKAQVTIQIVSIPAHTPVNSSFYLAGNFNNWNPADSNYRFVKMGNLYQAIIHKPLQLLEFKVTRGSWTTCEGDSSGVSIPNRTYTYKAGDKHQIVIRGWEAQHKIQSTAGNGVSVLSEEFDIPQLGVKRRVWIYLPQGYSQYPQQSYPVMYMHDGQNVFDQATSFSGEWGVDETLTELERQGKQACIVVAVDNGGISRLDEYSPYQTARGGGKGEQYVLFLVNTLKPYIDSHYRTKPDRNNTIIAGSSMGGYISLYATVRYPQVFGKAGIFSPAFGFSDSIYTTDNFTRNLNRNSFYLVGGEKEYEHMAPSMYRMRDELIKAGCKQENIKVKVDADGTHIESYWRTQFRLFYEWCMP